MKNIVINIMDLIILLDIQNKEKENKITELLEKYDITKEEFRNIKEKLKTGEFHVYAGDTNVTGDE